MTGDTWTVVISIWAVVALLIGQLWAIAGVFVQSYHRARCERNTVWYTVVAVGIVGVSAVLRWWLK